MENINDKVQLKFGFKQPKKQAEKKRNEKLCREI